MERIGVFLSSSNNVNSTYIAAAEQLGTWIGKQGKTLVYGGMAQGLMEILAQATKKNGGHIVGLIPDGDHWQNKQSKFVDMEFLCTNLADRKQTAIQESDIFVALPGGIGTLDEIFSVLAAICVHEHNKKIVIYNVAHCWDKLIELLEDLKHKKLISESLDNMLLFTDSFDQLTQLLEKD